MKLCLSMARKNVEESKSDISELCEMGKCHKACFIGLGYVGLPTAVVTAVERDGILGVDINPKVVEMTNNGRLHFVEPGLEALLQKVIENGRFRASSKPEIAEAYFIVVPTPLDANKCPDISYVKKAIEDITPLLKSGDLVVIESTCPVGTTENMASYIFSMRPELKGDIYMAYCPERVLPGNVIEELIHNDRVIGGIDKKSTDKAAEFYSKIVKGELHKTDSRTAELCKLTENSSRDVQIAFANELSLVCDAAGVDVWELIRLANMHPRVNILKPGCGVGGHCIAVDPYFITSAYPHEAKLIAKAREVNRYKSLWVTERISNSILEFERKNHRLPVVAMMGLAFKPDIDDLRESPAVFITSTVMDKHPDVKFLIVEPYLKAHIKYDLVDYEEAYQMCDIAVFLTAHKQFFKLLFKDKTVLDFCGILK